MGRDTNRSRIFLRSSDALIEDLHSRILFVCSNAGRFGVQAREQIKQIDHDLTRAGEMVTDLLLLYSRKWGKFATESMWLLRNLHVIDCAEMWGNPPWSNRRVKYFGNWIQRKNLLMLQQSKQSESINLRQGRIRVMHLIWAPLTCVFRTLRGAWSDLHLT